MDGRARQLTADRGAYRVMEFRSGRCAALEMDAAAGCYRCAIYAMRPDCCRWLVPGSALCRESRARDLTGRC